MNPTLPGLKMPVGTLYGIGRNYAAHAKELGNAVPEEPLIFLKPVSALVFDGGEVQLPDGVGRVDYEGEIVVVIGKGGKFIPEASALAHVSGYAVGIDVTARDLQSEAKKKGHPWAVSKGFDTFAVLGPILPAAGQVPTKLEFFLSVNGEVRQRGRAKDMERSIAKLIASLSKVFTLAPGDLIYSGTPEGVGPLHAGDRVEMDFVPACARLTVTVAGPR